MSFRGVRVRSAAFCVLLYAGCVQAETWISMGFTKHSPDKEYCEVNAGVFRDWRFGDATLFVGVQGKSDCEAGGVVGAAYQPLRLGNTRTGGMVLGLTG